LNFEANPFLPVPPFSPFFFDTSRHGPTPVHLRLFSCLVSSLTDSLSFWQSSSRPFFGNDPVILPVMRLFPSPYYNSCFPLCNCVELCSVLPPSLLASSGITSQSVARNVHIFVGSSPVLPLFPPPSPHFSVSIPLIFPRSVTSCNIPHHTLVSLRPVGFGFQPKFYSISVPSG